MDPADYIPVLLDYIPARLFVIFVVIIAPRLGVRLLKYYSRSQEETHATTSGPQGKNKENYVASEELPEALHLALKAPLTLFSECVLCEAVFI